jgi:hypothetical protein
MPQEQPKPISVTFQDNSTMQKVVDLVVRKRPRGWSRRSHATYYKECYALWIKKDVDAMILDRKPRIFEYEQFPKLSQISIYNMICQALMYLREELDDDKNTYHKFRQEIKVSPQVNIGILMQYPDALVPGSQAKICEGITKKPKWKEKMDEYLDDETAVKPFHIEGLLLQPSEIEQIEAELSGLSNVIYSVSAREIKIIKGQ